MFTHYLWFYVEMTKTFFNYQETTTLIRKEEEIRCVFDDKLKILFCQIFITNLCCGCSIESPR